MADNFRQFSCALQVGSAENAVRAHDIHVAFAADVYREEGFYPDFEMEVDHDNGAGALWLYSDTDGEPGHVIQFVLRCAEELDLQGVWGFTWAYTCSQPRLDAFGGRAIVIDLGKRATIADLDWAAWLRGQISTHAPCNAEQAVAPS